MAMDTEKTKKSYTVVLGVLFALSGVGLLISSLMLLFQPDWQRMLAECARLWPGHLAAAAIFGVFAFKESAIAHAMASATCSLLLLSDLLLRGGIGGDLLIGALLAIVAAFSFATSRLYFKFPRNPLQIQQT
jgi:hypothetical protein